jgi:hypothetical protein
MADVAVTIKGGKISVNKPRVTISLSSKEPVNWISPDGSFLIYFKTAAWPSPHTNPRGRDWHAFFDNFPKTGIYTYGIVAPGADPLDPEIEVIP